MNNDNLLSKRKRLADQMRSNLKRRKKQSILRKNKNKNKKDKVSD